MKCSHCGGRLFIETYPSHFNAVPDCKCIMCGRNALKPVVSVAEANMEVSQKQHKYPSYVQ